MIADKHIKIVIHGINISITPIYLAAFDFYCKDFVNKFMIYFLGGERTWNGWTK